MDCAILSNLSHNFATAPVITIYPTDDAILRHLSKDLTVYIAVKYPIVT